MKIMVIDDEPIVTKALRKLIPWEEHGFEWLPSAENGCDALDKIQACRPDLIVVDCQMPLMNGLELLEEINRLHLPIKSLILSGHDEFAYAQQAIKLGASDYLLKPPDIDLLLRLALKIKQEWEEEQRLKKQLGEQLPLIRYRFLQSLLEGAGISEQQFCEKTAYLNIPLKPGPYMIGVMEIAENPDYPRQYGYEDQQLMNFAVLNVAEETLSAHPGKYLFHETGSRFIMIVNVSGSTAGKEQLMATFHRLVSNLQETLHYDATIGVSGSGDSLNRDARACLEGAITALEYQYYTGPNEVIAVDDLEWERASSVHGKKVSAYPVDESLRKALKIGNPVQLNRWMEDFKSHLIERDYPVQVTKSVTLQAMASAAQALCEIHPRLSTDELLDPARIERFLTAASIEQLGKEIESYLGELAQLTVSLRKSGKNAVVEKTKCYIQKHYKEHITLETAARQVFLTPVYLSFLFKQVEGVNLSDYVTDVRMRQAKKLLSGTTMRTYEVAAQTGYTDEKYFSRLFKKRFGLTPTEFRNNSMTESTSS
ncbi:response regulator [Paenibacillus sp. J5C_2022]|uniref:response regulator n=1 Tax=Paenibacillus sp. J5C2022 TaxID=2977129 RepID=UPI0021CEB4E7|nr:response regulator [Paenibacillus sp. J5C2022]MCU6709829.1 response regulator [Paenibacillus sp. J5C2022]